jgi:two-component system sensor histidine kinase UhpB
MTKAKIMIVENERLVAKEIAGMLDQAGYSSMIAASGLEALGKIDGEKPDLILMDIILQDGMDGFESVRLIRSRLDVPVIYLTGHSNEEFIEAAKKTGALGYILKPFDGKELQIAIGLALSLYAKDQSLRQMQAGRDMFLDLSADVFCLLDSEFRIREVNGSGLGIWGLSKDDLRGKEIIELLIPAERKRCLEEFKRVWQTGEPSSVPELALPEKFDDHVVSLQLFKTGEWLGVVVSDITSRKRLESALKESEVRYRIIVESMTEGVVMQDERGRITYANQMFKRMTGYGDREILGRSLTEFIDPDHQDEFKTQMNAATRDGKQSFELTLKNRAGQSVLTIGSVTFLRNDHGFPGGSMTILSDLTGRQKVEDELRRSRQELRNLSRHLQSVREDESKRISREIHDELGQALTVLKIDLSRLSHRLKDPQLDRKQTLDRIESMMTLLDKTIIVIQKIASELRPGLLDDLGLVPAIEWQAQEFENRTGIRCRFSADAVDVLLEPDCATAVFRIVQEALTNVARHANADCVDINIERKAQKLYLMIRDNGRGISPEEASSSNSLGLIGMRERLLPFGGTIRIIGSPGRGTTLRLSFDLENQP